MKMKLLSVVLTGLAIVMIFTTSCKSEFEKIRSSGDTEMLYRKAFEYYDKGEYQKAQTLFELIISIYRGKKEAEEIFFKYAYTYYHLGSYILASHYFTNFANTYSASERREEADFMAAYSHYQLSPSFRLDQSYTAKAIDGFQLFVNTYPHSERVEECNNLIDEMREKLERKAYDEARLYFDLRQYQAANQSFENMLKDFPEMEDAENVRYMIIKASFLLAENSVLEKRIERYQNTIDKSSEFLTRFPESKHHREVNNIYTTSQKKLNQISNVGYQNQSARAGS